MSETPPREPEPTEHTEEALDEALEETFPASDPIATGEFEDARNPEYVRHDETTRE